MNVEFKSLGAIIFDPPQMQGSLECWGASLELEVSNVFGWIRRKSYFLGSFQSGKSSLNVPENFGGIYRNVMSVGFPGPLP